VAALDRDEFLAFAGEAPSSARVHTYREKLAPALRTDDARRFWAGRSDWLERGMHQAGSLERHFGLWRGVMRMVQGDRRIRQLFECHSLAEQKKFFDAEWNRALYRGVVRMFFNRRALSLAKHPDHFRYVTEKDIAGSFLMKSQHAITDLPVRDNYFLAQIFLGRYLSAEAVPPFLQAAAYERVRGRLDRLELVTGDLASALDSLPAGQVRAFYLSNICEWMPDEEVERLFESMTRAAAPGARATKRTLLADREVPARFRERWRQLEPLSTDLHFHDRSFLYSTYRVLELA
jgi:S-adenosylmethionine-diacylglycerol 3-amino-3-carboxypropyl transferase